MANSKEYEQGKPNLRRSASERRPEDYTNKAFFVMPNTHPLRSMMLDLSVNKYFTNFILLCIAINCVFLSLGHPVASCCHTVGDDKTIISDFKNLTLRRQNGESNLVYELNADRLWEITEGADRTERCADDGVMGKLFINGRPWPWFWDGNTPPQDAVEGDGDGLPDGSPTPEDQQDCCINVCNTYEAYGYVDGTYTALDTFSAAGAEAKCEGEHLRLSHLMCASQSMKNTKIIMEYILNVIFIIEMVIKLLAMGSWYFYAPGSGVDGFNCLDFGIVWMSILTMAGVMPNVSGVRAIRAIKPLRSLNAIPSLKLVIDGLVNSVVPLLWVFALAIVLFTLFGVSGMMLFGGRVNGRCHFINPGGAGGNYLEEGAAGLFYGAGWCANGTDCRNPIDEAPYPLGPVAKNTWFANMILDESNEAPCVMPCHSMYIDGEISKPGDGNYPDPIDWASGGLRGDGWGRFTPGCMETGLGFTNYEGFKEGNTPRVVNGNVEDPGLKTETEVTEMNAPGYGGLGMVSPGSLLNRCEQNPVEIPNPFFGLPVSPPAVTANFSYESLVENYPQLKITHEGKEYDRAKSLSEHVLKLYGQTHWQMIFDPAKRTIALPSFCLDTGNSQLGGGYAGWDNFLTAVGTLFTSLTLEGWVDIMYGGNAVFGLDFVTFMYWIMVVFLCAFYMMELCLAVIGDNYDEAKEAAEALEEEEAAEGGSATAGDDSDDSKAKDTGLFGLPQPTEETAVVGALWPLVTSDRFNMFITFCILLNTLTLSMDHYEYDYFGSDPNGLLHFLWYSNVFFVVVFLVEMILKLLTFGKLYAADAFNLFDGFLVVMSTLEFVMEVAATAGGLPPGLSVLRAFRLFRVLKLAKGNSAFQKELRSILSVIMDGVASCASAALLLGVILLIFVLVGMSVFAGNWRAEFYGGLDDIPLTNFDTFVWSAVACFQVLTGENWNEVMYAGLTACNSDEYGYDGEPKYHDYSFLCGTGVVLYFVLLNLIGNYMVLNLFLAILMAGFDEEEEDEEEGGLHLNNPFGDHQDKKEKKPETPGPGASAKIVPAGEGYDDAADSSGAGADSDKPAMTGTLPIAKSCYSVVYNPLFENFILFCILLGTFNLMFEPPGAAFCYEPTRNFPYNLPDHLPDYVKNTAVGESIPLPEGDPIPWEAINPGTRIFFNETTQQLETAPEGVLVPDPTPVPGLEHYVGCKNLGDYQLYVGILFNIFFIIELVLKIIAINPKAYFIDPWNWLDFLVVIVGIIDMSKAAEGLSWLKGLRAMRALKPLRTVKRVPSLAIVVKALIRAAGASAATFLVLFIFLLIFGVSGVMFFSGKMNLCNNPDAQTSSGLTGPVPHPDAVTMWDCLGYNITVVEDKPTTMYVSYGGYDENTTLVKVDWPGPTNVNYSYEGGSGVKWPREDKLENYQGFAKDDIPVVDGREVCTAEMCLQQDPTCTHLVDPMCECRCFDAVEDTCELLPNQTLIDMCVAMGTAGLPNSIPVRWQSLPINFNDVFQGIGVVLEVASGEMWPDIMYTTQDVFGYNMPMHAPPHYFGRTAALWYIFVTFVIAFMMLQVFIGQVISVYEDIKSDSEGQGLITESQAAFRQAMLDGVKHKAAKKRYPRGCYKDGPAVDPLTQKLFDAINDDKFDNFIMACILINALVMMINYDTQPGPYTVATTAINLLLLIIFTLEAIVKIIALGPFNKEGNDSGYFDDKDALGNRFDFTLVILGWVGDTVNFPLFSLFRILRVLRVLRAVKGIPDLMLLVTTFFVAFPAIFNVFLVMMLFLLIFGVVFMSLFGMVRMMPGSDLGETALINSDANFMHFWPAFVTCFRMVTGESFNGIMHDASVKMPYCDPDAHGVGNCGVPFIGVFVIFNFFFILTSYILLSLILGTIIDNYGEVKAASDRAVNEKHFEAFQAAWKIFDDDGDEMIPEEHLVEVLKMVDHPLGIKHAPPGTFDEGLPPRKQANRLIQQLNIKIVAGQVNYTETLMELIKYGMPDAELPESLKDEIDQMADKKLKNAKGLRRLNTDTSGEMGGRYNVSQSKAISLVQAAMQGYIYRRKLEAVVEAVGQTQQESGASAEGAGTNLPPIG